MKFLLALVHQTHNLYFPFALLVLVVYAHVSDVLVFLAVHNAVAHGICQFVVFERMNRITVLLFQSCLERVCILHQFEGFSHLGEFKTSVRNGVCLDRRAVLYKQVSKRQKRQYGMPHIADATHHVCSLTVFFHRLLILLLFRQQIAEMDMAKRLSTKIVNLDIPLHGHFEVHPCRIYLIAVQEYRTEIRIVYGESDIALQSLLAA